MLPKSFRSWSPRCRPIMIVEVEQFKWKEVNEMQIPGFTAESSLYKTSGHYQAVRHAINSPTQMISAISPAAISQPGEVIDVCEEDPSLCWGPPLTEPPTGGGGDGGGPDDGPPDGGYGGGGGTPPKPRGCKESDFGSFDDFGKAVE